MTTQVDIIRVAIKDKLLAVAGIANAYEFERFAKDQSKFRSLYETAEAEGKKRVNGWNVRRVRMAEKQLDTATIEVTTEWQIKGFLGLDDESETELAFDNQIEAIGDAFRADQTLGELVAGTSLQDGTAGIQLDDSGPVMFAGVLCHAAKLRLYTIHYLGGQNHEG